MGTGMQRIKVQASTAATVSGDERMNAEMPSRSFCVSAEEGYPFDWLVARAAGRGFSLFFLGTDTDLVASIRVLQPDVLCLVRKSGGMKLRLLCRALRAVCDGSLLVMVENCFEEEQVSLLDSGADEVLPAPVGSELARARVEALLRAVSRRPAKPAEAVPDNLLHVNNRKRLVRVGGRLANLTTLEYDVLYYLVENSGRVVSRDDIRRALAKAESPVYDRSVDMYISRIRRKIGDDPAAPRYLKTVRGAGYLFMGETNAAFGAAQAQRQVPAHCYESAL